MAAPTNFTSLTSATIAAADYRRSLVTIENDGPGTLYVLRHGGSVASSTNCTHKLGSGASITIRGDEYLGEIRGIFSSAGTARVTVSTLFN